MPVPVRVKEHLCRIRRPYGKMHTHRFNDTVGDIPVWAFNPMTSRREAVVNTRGLAYAARKRQAYRNRPTKFKGNPYV